MPAKLEIQEKTSLIKLLCTLAALISKIIIVNAQGFCDANERWTNCMHSVCGPKTCDDLGYPLNCTIDPRTPCVGGCICIDQYLRNSENQCIPVEQCPSCAGDVNAIAGSGSHCGNLCSNYKQLYVFCTEEPNYNSCDCKKGYVFNDIIGKCIHPHDCPKPCNGDHYAEAKECAAPIQPTCVNPHVNKTHECRPPGSCECIYPYVLHKPGGKCVRFDTCQGAFSIKDFFSTLRPSPPLPESTTMSQYESNVIVSTSGFSGSELAARMKIDTQVVRGRDWMYGDEDGGKGGKGTVVRGLLNGLVRVEWDSGKYNSYRMGIDNKYDLDLDDLPSTPKTTTTTTPKPTTTTTTMPEPTTTTTPKPTTTTSTTTTTTTTPRPTTTTPKLTTTTRKSSTTTTTPKPTTYTTEINLSGPELESQMKIDTRVVRGKDWKYGNEDGGKGAKGTVIRGLLDGFVRVEWDTGKTNSYRMGYNNKYDLNLADLPSTLQPSTMEKAFSGPKLAMQIKINTRVVRGKDWAYGDQDGGKGSVGTVVSRLSGEGRVRVEWDTGRANSYRMGFGGKYDLDLADPSTTPE